MPALSRSLLGPQLAATLLLSATPALADDAGDLRVTGSMRLRFETIDGQARAGFNPGDQLWTLRTILRAQVRAKPLTFVAEVHDSRAWGANAGTPLSTGEVNALELVQAYAVADLGAAFGHGSDLNVRVGRFTLDLGSERLVIDEDYRNTTNGFTGVRGDFTSRAGTKATLFYTLPQVRMPSNPAGLRAARIAWDRESFDLRFWGGIVATPLTRGGQASDRVMAETSFYRLDERSTPARPTQARGLATLDARLYRKAGAARGDFEIEGAYQWGSARPSTAVTAARLPVRAGFVHAEAGYTLPGHLRLRLSGAFDYASGGAGDGGVYRRFDPLFGGRRFDLGPSGIYSAIGRANLVSPQARVAIAPGTRFDAFAAWRPLWLANARDAFATTGVRDPAGQSGRFAGNQVEARARYWLVPAKVRMEATGALLFKSGFLKTAPNATPGKTARYLSLNLSASL